MTRKYGYARVSTTGQNLDRQIIALKKYVPAENVVVDKQSGKNLDRLGYQSLKSQLGLRAGDQLYITSLDRLSRNKNDIKEELKWFRDHEIRLMILDLPTSLIEVPDGQGWIIEMINNVLIEVLASIAEQERLTIRKRQREGIEAAKKKGKHLGRPCLQISDNFPEVFEEWQEKKITAKDAMKQLGMSSSSFYRIVRQYKEKNMPASI